MESLQLIIEDDKMSKTAEHLKEAFAGESQANRRYTAFAKRADAQGFPQIAKLFRAAAEAETVHALNHLRIMGEIKTTAENLNAAIEGETFEFQQMYPEYLKTSEQEKNQQASWSFDVANKVEKIHADLFTKTLEALRKKQLSDIDYYVCSVCGNTVENAPPETCPVCGAAKRAFSKVV